MGWELQLSRKALGRESKTNTVATLDSGYVKVIWGLSVHFLTQHQRQIEREHHKKKNNSQKVYTENLREFWNHIKQW